MDPNANLREQREIAADVMRIWDACPEDGEFTDEQEHDLVHYAYRLAELVQALDGWIKGGGFLPDSWKIAQKRNAARGLLHFVKAFAEVPTEAEQRGHWSDKDAMDRMIQTARKLVAEAEGR